MKKKYLYNGQIMQEADVLDAAKQSNLDLDTYIQKAGIKPVEDMYSYQGKDFSAEDVLDAANQSKLGFDDYIQKAGFAPKLIEKKNQLQNGSGNGTTTPVPSILPSTEKPAAKSGITDFDKPFDQFIPQKLDNAQIPQPLLKKPPLQILQEDYLSNKEDNDRVLTSTIGSDPTFGKAVSGDSLLRAMADPNDADNRLLEKYSKKRIRDFNNELEVRKQEINKKYPDVNLNVGTELGAMGSTSLKPQEYYAEIDSLNKEIEAKRDGLLDAVRTIASVKVINDEMKIQGVAVPKFDKKRIGKEIRRAVADPTLAREERLELKGIPLSPSEKFYNDKAGYIAMATALKEMDDNGVDIQNDLQAKALFDNVKSGKAELLSENKEFTRQQAGKLISNEIAKDKNWFQVMTGVYTINNDDIKKYAKQLNIPDKIAEQVTEKDIQTANIFGTFANELAARPGANIGTFFGRPFRREVLGQDPDAIDYHYEQLNKKFTTALAENPEELSLFSSPTEIQGDATQENYLEDVRNLGQNKFNWSGKAIANTIANGAGQMIQYGLGGTAVGGGLSGVNKLLGATSNVEKSKKVGLVTYGFLNAYEPSYQSARQVVGDDPDKEAQRNIVASLNAGVQAISELIFPDYKVTDKLFGVGSSASNMLLDKLSKDGAKGLTDAFAKKTVVTAIKEGLVKTGGGTVKEIGEEEAAIAGEIVVNLIANKKSLEDRDIPEELLQTAITTAISSLIPIGAGELMQSNRTSGVKKSLIHEIGSDPATYINHINSEVLDGRISQPVANKKISVVNTMSGIVKKDVPDISPITQKPLTEKDKVDYAYNLLHQRMLDDKLETTTDDVQKEIIEKQIGELKVERHKILNDANGVEKNFAGEPIYERDISSPIKSEKDAVQERSPEKVLQPTQEGTGKEGGGRGSLEQDEQGKEITEEKGVLTPEEKEGWDSLTMQEKLALAKNNLPDVSDMSNREIVDAADQRAKELLNITQEKPEDKLTPAEQKIKEKLADLFPQEEELTPVEKKQWGDLSREEKLALAKENLPEVETLTERDIIKVADQRAKELLAKQPAKEPIKEGMTDDQQLKFIAEQAQNIQADGSVSTLQTPEAAKKAAVNTFGKKAVDEAIEAHPLGSLTKPVAPADDVVPNQENSEKISDIESRRIYSNNNISKTGNTWNGYYRDADGRQEVVKGNTKEDVQGQFDKLYDAELAVLKKQKTPATEGDVVPNLKDENFKIDNQDTFYHASNKKRRGRLSPNTATQFGQGVYFSTDKERVKNEFGENVTEVKLNISNPVSTNTLEWHKVEELAIKKANEGKKRDEDDIIGEETDIYEIPGKFISDAAKELGHDAIIDKNSGNYKNEILVLDESKIFYPEDLPETKTTKTSKEPDAGKQKKVLEEKRDAEIKAASKPDVKLNFIAEDNLALDRPTGKKIIRKSGKRRMEDDETYRDVQDEIIKKQSLLEKLLACI